MKHSLNYRTVCKQSRLYSFLSISFRADSPVSLLDYNALLLGTAGADWHVDCFGNNADEV